MSTKKLCKHKDFTFVAFNFKYIYYICRPKKTKVMTKQEVILQIRQAHIAHIKWRSTAQAIHMGMPMLEKKVDLLQTDCAFGQWYYGDGQHLSLLETYQRLEPIHDKIHHIYQSIFHLSNKKQKSSFLKLKTFDESIHKKQIAAYFKDMAKASKNFLQVLKELETDIANLPDKYFERKNTLGSFDEKIF